MGIHTVAEPVAIIQNHDFAADSKLTLTVWLSHQGANVFSNEIDHLEKSTVDTALLAKEDVSLEILRLRRAIFLY